MWRAAASLALGVALVSGSLAVSSGSGAVGQAAKVLDRTYRCAVGVEGGIRSVNVSAQTGVRDLDDRTKWSTPPHFLLTTVVGSSGARVWAGRAVADPWSASWVDTFYVFGCLRTAATVRFATKGLDGGRASQFGDRYQCPAPRTVLARVRVEFVRRASVGNRSQVPVRSGALAIRTISGKPIAHADVLESGRARLFAARSCIPE